MTVKNAPATRLPWESISNLCLRVAERSGPVLDLIADLRYAKHAANAYPKLVESLRKCATAIEESSNADGVPGRAARALLAEIGEAP